MMFYKLIVNQDSGIQKFVKVKKSGRYLDSEKVVWDERVHGPIPQGTELGGLQRYTNNGAPALRVIAAQKTAHDDTLAAIETAKQEEETQMQQAKQLIRNINQASTAAELKAVLRALVRVVARELL